MSRIPKAQRDKLAQRSHGACEICFFAYATNWHHRKNRSQGGDNSLSNAMHLCGSGTTGCHGMVTENPALAYENGWSVRSGHDPAIVPVLRFGSDWVLIDNEGGITAYKEGA